MRILVDTNVLTRAAQKNHPHTYVAEMTLETLWSEGHELRVVPQVLYEYWSVATRPAEQNGLGFPPQLVAADLDHFKAVFSVLRDERGIFEPWHRIALERLVLGKQAHDARLVAAMQRHGLTHLLTFNVADFQRYPDITILDPQAITTS